MRLYRSFSCLAIALLCAVPAIVLPLEDAAGATVAVVCMFALTLADCILSETRER